MAVLEHLEPRKVFSFFEQLCAIPHGSGNTKAISDWLVRFAEERNLEHYQDTLNNVIIIKEATPGYEAAAPVILQGHMDMVCEKAPDCGKDMAAEGLDLVVDGDTVYAKGTTLGGDDGIAVSMALAVLDDASLPHPRVETVITVDEEIGMLGADSLDVSLLKAKQMINIDSEAEGIFTVSCAGGCAANCTLPIHRAAFDGAVLTVSVSGLLGGHSGAEIHKGRANSNMLLGRILYAAQKETPLRVIAVDGGAKDNAIPNASAAVIAAAQADAVKSACAEMERSFRAEYFSVDGGINVTVSETGSGLPMDKESSEKVTCMLQCVPNGVQTMSGDIEGLVQTSLNLGILQTEEIAVKAVFCIRSSIATQKQMLVDRLQCLMTQLGGTLEVKGDYPGWAYRHNSPLRDTMAEVFQAQYGHPPVIEAIHAGLECGLFAGKIPDLDCISIGPDLTEIHTARERMHIASVQRTWALLTETLKRMK